jgi:hypothetical protein
MIQEYTSIKDQGVKTVTSTGNAVRIDDPASQGRRNITITNPSGVDVFVKRISDPSNAPVAPIASTLSTTYTYRIPAGSTLDDPVGDYIAYFAAVGSGTASVYVQECY